MGAGLASRPALAWAALVDGGTEAEAMMIRTGCSTASDGGKIVGTSAALNELRRIVLRMGALLSCSTRYALPYEKLVKRESPAVRKPAKTFVTEYKSRKPPKHAALFDEGMVHGDHLPSRDINAEVAELPDEGHDRRYEEALRAADSVFGGPKPREETEASSEAPEDAARTVLSDLSYKDPLGARLAAASLVKRGRKPGSKNKPKLAQTNDAPAPVSAEPKAQFAATGTAAKIVQVHPLVQRRQRVGFLKLQQARRATKPGDRWKLKLPGR